MANQQKDDATSRSDTTSPGGARPVQGQSGKVGSGQGGSADRGRPEQREGAAAD